MTSPKNRGVPFPAISPDMNRDGQTTAADLAAQERRKQAILAAMRKRTPAPIQEDVTGALDNANAEQMQDTPPEASKTKAELLSLHNKSGEVYNMLSDTEAVEGWIADKIAQASSLMNDIHNSMVYEKSKSNTIGSGEGTPAEGPPVARSSIYESASKGWRDTVKKMRTHKHAPKGKK